MAISGLTRRNAAAHSGRPSQRTAAPLAPLAWVRRAARAAAQASPGRKAATHGRVAPRRDRCTQPLRAGGARSRALEAAARAFGVRCPMPEARSRALGVRVRALGVARTRSRRDGRQCGGRSPPRAHGDFLPFTPCRPFHERKGRNQVIPLRPSGPPPLSQGRSFCGSSPKTGVASMVGRGVPPSRASQTLPLRQGEWRGCAKGV